MVMSVSSFVMEIGMMVRMMILMRMILMMILMMIMMMMMILMMIMMIRMIAILLLVLLLVLAFLVLSPGSRLKVKVSGLARKKFVEYRYCIDTVSIQYRSTQSGPANIFGADT